MGRVYNDAELYSYGNFPVYTRQHTEAAMLLGGIGTGSLTVGSRGQLKDWELFNHPDKGRELPYTFFAVHGDDGSGAPRSAFTTVLESRLTPPYTHHMGMPAHKACGWPRFASSEMRVRFPFVNILLKDPDLPIEAEMEAFNPFIPLNADDSGIPGAVIRFHIKNTGTSPLKVSVAGTMFNASCFAGIDAYMAPSNLPGGKPFNRYQEQDGLRGIVFDSTGLAGDDPSYGNLAFLTDAGDISYKADWQMGQRIDGLLNFWNEFDSTGRLSNEPEVLGVKGKWDHDIEVKVGSLAVHHDILPGETKTFQFFLTWYFPKRKKAWDHMEGYIPKPAKPEIVRNYYATLFSSAWDAGTYLAKNLPRLERDSRAFAQAVYGSTLPDYVIDAMTANLTILKSTTCFRLENGHFFGYEGSNLHEGSCAGNCSHVWYYAQAVAYLFPELERSMRETNFLVETDEDGVMQFRACRELNGASFNFLPAVDGQMGTLMQLYREWLLSGDDDFLKRIWPKAILAMEYAINNWDTDGDYVLDGMMHVDYDVEFYGPNPLGNFCYLGALKACEKMAAHLKDAEHEARYRSIFEQASKIADVLMWNGEYYIQILADVDEYKYQHGTGCLADQLIGQFYADLTGLGYLADKEHISRAAHSIFKYCFVDDFSKVKNMQRTYAVNDDKGLCMTTWPFGGRPKQPFFYSDEAWSRTEYHVAATLIYEGFLEEGLTVTKAVRQRYDGIRRNPWNEFESGFHYSGTMSSWGLLPALSGFLPDMPENKVTFSPKINRENFRCFWSTGKAWGIYEQKITDGKLTYQLTTLYGNSDGLKVEVR